MSGTHRRDWANRIEGNFIHGTNNSIDLPQTYSTNRLVFAELNHKELGTDKAPRVGQQIQGFSSVLYTTIGAQGLRNDSTVKRPLLESQQGARTIGTTARHLNDDGVLLVQQLDPSTLTSKGEHHPFNQTGAGGRTPKRSDNSIFSTGLGRPLGASKPAGVTNDRFGQGPNDLKLPPTSDNFGKRRLGIPPNGQTSSSTLQQEELSRKVDDVTNLFPTSWATHSLQPQHLIPPPNEHHDAPRRTRPSSPVPSASPGALRPTSSSPPRTHSNLRVQPGWWDRLLIPENINGLSDGVHPFW